MSIRLRAQGARYKPLLLAALALLTGCSSSPSLNPSTAGTKPELFTVRAVRWVDDKPQYDTVGEYQREYDQSELKALIADGLSRAAG